MRNKREQRRRNQVARWARLRRRVANGNIIAIPYTVADLKREIAAILAVGMEAWTASNRHTC